MIYVVGQGDLGDAVRRRSGRGLHHLELRGDREGEAPADAFRLDDVPGVAVVVEKAVGTKCARSWKILPTVGEDPEYPDVSPRDAQALREWKALGVASNLSSSLRRRGPITTGVRIDKDDDRVFQTISARHGSPLRGDDAFLGRRLHMTSRSAPA